MDSEADEIRDRILSADTKMPSITLELANKSHSVRFTEKHLFHLQTMIELDIQEPYSNSEG